MCFFGVNGAKDCPAQGCSLSKLNYKGVTTFQKEGFHTDYLADYNARMGVTTFQKEGFHTIQALMNDKVKGVTTFQKEGFHTPLVAKSIGYEV